MQRYVMHKQTFLFNNRTQRLHCGAYKTSGAGLGYSSNQCVAHVERDQDACCFCLCHGLRDGCGDFSKHGVSDDYANGTDNDIRSFTGDNN